MKYLLLILFIGVGCKTESEIKISATTIDEKDLPTSEPTDPTPTTQNTNPDPDEQTQNSNDPVLIFSESFDYANTSDQNFTTKWDSYNSSLQSIENSSWTAVGSGWWGSSIISKQTFNLPVTIEWDQDSDYNSGGASAYDGLCIYEGNISRQENYQFVISGDNYGCFGLMTYFPDIHVSGVFIDTNQNTYTERWSRYFIAGVAHLKYRATLNIREDLTYKLTLQYIDHPNDPFLISEGALNISNQSNPLDNFKIEFNSSDYQGYKTHYDNIKVFDSGDVDPSAL